MIENNDRRNAEALRGLIGPNYGTECFDYHSARYALKAGLTMREMVTYRVNAAHEEMKPSQVKFIGATGSTAVY